MRRNSPQLDSCPRRWLALAGILFLLSISLAVLFLFPGMVIPIRVASGSMGDFLPGPHRQIPCQQCGFTYRVGVDTSRTDRTICPNCGVDGHAALSLKLHEGQRVLIDRRADLFRRPRRWDVVVSRHPRRPAKLVVKRIIGLPGESIRLQHGDIFVDDRLCRKTSTQMSRMAILVHDNDHRPPDKLNHAWRPRWASTGWRVSAGRYAFWSRCTPHQPATPAHDADGDWLTFDYSYVCPASRAQQPILDDYGYNQGNARTLHAVYDLLLSGTFQARGKGDVRFRFNLTGQHPYEFRCHTGTGLLELWRAGTRIHVTQTSLRLDGPAVPFLVACYDQRLSLTLFQQELLVYDAEHRSLPSPMPWALAGSGNLDLQLRDLKVWRDIHYLHPDGSDSLWETQLENGTYLLVGDNVPVSRDGRHGEEFGLVSRRDILGGFLKWNQ